MRPRLLSAAALLLALTVAAPAARASHYPLEGVSYISEKDRKAFEQIKILDTMELLDALLTPEARKSVSGKTGIAVDTLLEYVRLCDLLRIRGVGPKMARLISLCGVTGTAALGKEVAAPLLEKMKEKNKVNLVSELLPQVETVEDWIQQARELPVVVKER